MVDAYLCFDLECCVKIFCVLTVADGFQQKASSGLGTDSTSSESGFGKNNTFMSSAELGSSTGIWLWYQCMTDWNYI